ncbi:copper resistance D family protein [Oceanobacillus bengalensis]|uniref:Copper resistance protein CopD n=1 Tax=Oceanobacillus bengalensis TaxID=1435466 RepID=A0A494YV89_9BACI|nr:CopD family protein [Oceanobacillus bengalensis]RKQ14042.1 copper resistance protein CopD [Oceanobacillus bengalensis]
MLLISLTEFLLYICFSLLIGYFILSLVSENKRPTIYIPKKVLYIVAGIIPIAAFLPVFQTAIILAGDYDFWLVIKNVVFTFEIGKAWLFMTFVSIILICVLFAKNFKSKTHLITWALVLTLLMLLGYTRSSHAATITEWQGFLFHSLHFLAVTIWIGILFVVSWFSKNKNNWSAFLKWFTPVAIICLAITIVAGYFTMEIDINSYDDPNATVLQEYQNGLIVNYGQALLLKHIFIISLILFAFINGILFRRKNNQESFNPLKWARAESAYALIVFGLTAFMGQSWPPHQIYMLLITEGASPLFEAIYDGEIVNVIQNASSSDTFNVTVSFGMESYLLFGLGLLFMVLTIFAAIKRNSVFISTFSALLMVLSVYVGIMLGVQ